MPRELRPAAITAPTASRIGDRSINRVRSTVVFISDGVKPGVTIGTRAGARSHVIAASGATITIMRLAMVEMSLLARRSSPRAMSSEATGTSAEPMAPAATS